MTDKQANYEKVKNVIDESLSGQTSLTTNLELEVHVTTRDKVELALRRKLPDYTSGSTVAALLSVFLAFLAVLVTASDFKDFMYVDGVTWHAMFVLGAVVSAGFLIREAVRWRKSPGIDGVVTAVMAESTPYLASSDEGGNVLIPAPAEESQP